MTQALSSEKTGQAEEVLTDHSAQTNRLSANQQYLLPAAGHEPVQILTGEGVNDEVVTTLDGQSVDFVEGMLESLRNNSHYDYVMIYDPAKCQVMFLDEIEQKDGSVSRKMRAAIEKSGIKFMDATGEVNLVSQLLKENVLNPLDGLMPDRVLLELIDKLAREKKSKVLLIIDDAGDFIFTEPTGNQAEMLPSMNRVINRSLINSVAKKLRNFPGSKIVLIDRRGKLACLKGNHSEVRQIGTPERAELQPLVKEKITSEKWKRGVELSRGIALNKVRRVLAQHQGNEEDLLAKLKKFKEEEVTRLSGGSVKCNMDEYTREMVAMAEEESIFWDELATVLKDGRKNELLPQGVLLVGPPGTGKSVRAKYLASSMGVPYLELNNISSSGLRGIKEDRVRQAFEAAIAVKPCILFVDEIDKYLPRTEGHRSTTGAENDDSEVAAYIQRMMDSKEMNGVVIVGAGNNPDQMNEAMLRNGRFGLRVAVLSPKNLEEKVSIFKAVMKQLDQTHHIRIDDQLLQQLLMQPQFQNANGADYREIIRRSSLKQSVQSKKGFWTMFSQELKNFKLRQNSKITEMEDRSREMHTAPFELIEPKSQKLPRTLSLKDILVLAEKLDHQQVEEDKKKQAELEERREKARLATIAIKEEQEKNRLAALAIEQDLIKTVVQQTKEQNVTRHTQTTQGKETQRPNGRELSPEQTTKLLAKLKRRFETEFKPYISPEGIDWEDIQRALENSPEKLWSLNEMERTGGKPDVHGKDKKTGEYIFMDYSIESPSGRRNCVYNNDGEKYAKHKKYLGQNLTGNAIDLAASMGVNILTRTEYLELQTKGIFDSETLSWIKTPIEKANSNLALNGLHRGSSVYIRESGTHHSDYRWGFRASLRVAQVEQKFIPQTNMEKISTTTKEVINQIIHKLSPEKVKLLNTLKNRFENKNKHYKNPEGIKWKDIQRALEKSPEKLWSLHKMEKTGGEPDVIEYNKETSEYIFMDCSAESPEQRWKCVYDKKADASLHRRDSHEHNSNAEKMALSMGIEILDGKEYQKLQSKGVFDKKTLNWLKSSVNKKTFDDGYVVYYANFAGRGGSKILVKTDTTHNTDTDHISWGALGGNGNGNPRKRGFRGLLKVSDSTSLRVLTSTSVEKKIETSQREIVVANLNFGQKFWSKTLGKGPNCDIVLKGPNLQWVAKEHLTITHNDPIEHKNDFRFYISYIRKTDRIYINDELIPNNSYRQLKINDKLTLDSRIFYLRDNLDLVMIVNT